MFSRFEVYFVNLDPTTGSEIKKTRPCVIISPNEMNYNISTVIIAPMTTKSHPYPTRAPIKIEGKSGWIVLDQLRAIDKRRLMKRLGELDKNRIQEIKAIIKEMLVD